MGTLLAGHQAAHHFIGNEKNTRFVKGFPWERELYGTEMESICDEKRLYMQKNLANAAIYE